MKQKNWLKTSILPGCILNLTIINIARDATIYLRITIYWKFKTQFVLK